MKYHYDVFNNNGFRIFYKSTLQFNVQSASQSVVGVALLRHSPLLARQSVVNLVHNLSLDKGVFTLRFLPQNQIPHPRSPIGQTFHGNLIILISN